MLNMHGNEAMKGCITEADAYGSTMRTTEGIALYPFFRWRFAFRLSVGSSPSVGV